MNGTSDQAGELRGQLERQGWRIRGPREELAFFDRREATHRNPEGRRHVVRVGQHYPLAESDDGPILAIFDAERDGEVVLVCTPRRGPHSVPFMVSGRDLTH